MLRKFSEWQTGVLFWTHWFGDFFLDINGDLNRQLGIKAWSLEFSSLAGGANLQAIDTCLALKAMMRRVHQGSRCKQKREKN